MQSSPWQISSVRWVKLPQFDQKIVLKEDGLWCSTILFGDLPQKVLDLSQMLISLSKKSKADKDLGAKVLVGNVSLVIQYCLEKKKKDMDWLLIPFQTHMVSSIRTAPEPLTMQIVYSHNTH